MLVSVWDWITVGPGNGAGDDTCDSDQPGADCGDIWARDLANSDGDGWCAGSDGFGQPNFSHFWEPDGGHDERCPGGDGEGYGDGAAVNFECGDDGERGGGL